MLWIKLLKKRRSRKWRTRKGSATVLLCFLFVTLTGALAITFEAADRKAAISVGEAAFDNAGRSVLACYDKELFDRYGLFAFEGDEEKTEKRLEKLAKTSIENTKIADCKVTSVKAEQSAYCLSDPENLMVQIREITKRTALLDALGNLKDDLGNASQKIREKDQSEQKIRELEKECDEAKKNAEEAVKNARAEEETENAILQEADTPDPADELEKIEDAEKQQNHLKEQLNNMKGEPDLSGNEGRTLKNGRIIDSLPSASAGCRDRSAYEGGEELSDISIDGTGQAISDDLVTVAYIEHYFHNKMDNDDGEQNFFRCETEYILYGGMSDKWNYRKAYLSIFAVRTAANIAYLYIDSGKRNQTLTAAEMITPWPYTLLTQLLIVSLWASLESYNDMKNLENGRGVPLMKSKDTWMTDIDEVVKLIKGNSQEASYIPIPEGSHLTYSRYLDMFLLTLDRNTKLYRILDLIQINLKGTVREDFTIADHFTGFVLKAEIGKKSHEVGVRNATADINMTHAYLTGG